MFACGKCEYTGLGGRTDVLIPLLLDAFEGVPVKQVRECARGDMQIRRR